MIGNVQDFITYAGARGVIIDPAQAPIFLVKATDLLNTMCWVGKPVDPDQEDSWPRVDNSGNAIVDEKASPVATDSSIPAKIQISAFRLAMEVSGGVDLMPTTAGKQTVKESVSGAVAVEYDVNSIGAKPDFPWFDSLVGDYVICDLGDSINFKVGRG